MAVKIIFLLALFLPSILTAQINKEAFSVELKIDRTNFAFGEEVKPVIIIKNISGKRDSLTPNEIEDVSTANNLKIYQNSQKIGCMQITSSFIGNQNKIFEPGEELTIELALSYFCGGESLGRHSVYNILDTGFYNCYTYLGKIYNPQSQNSIYKKFESNEIFFQVHPPDSNEKKIFSEFRTLFDYSQEQAKDTNYMLSVLQKLNTFVRENINSYFGDAAFHISTFKSGFYNLYIDEEVNLAKFYLTNKPDGQQVNSALYFIYNGQYLKNHVRPVNYKVLEEYIDQYPNTKIESEAKKIIIQLQKQEKQNLLKTKKPGK